MADEWHFELTLPAIPSMAPVVRWFIRGILEFVTDRDRAAEGERVVGEMVTSALAGLPAGLQAGGLRVRAQRSQSDLVRVEVVEEGGSAAPDPRPVDDAGFALTLMTAHSLQWGVDRTQLGARVRWVEIPIGGLGQV